ncbi:MAG: aconitate hydratase AcnA [Actinobacteria bacterium]|nr:aconitate hydratase AcnA [Actinomycetota bacterium]
MAASTNPFGARATLSGAFGTVGYYRLGALASEGASDVDRLPFTVRILLENLLRQAAGGRVGEQDVLAMALWRPNQPVEQEFPFMPARVLTQDLTGVPAVVDLAAMRSAVARLGGDPHQINPLVPVDLVIDHSVQIDRFGSSLAFQFNVGQEQQRNRERYLLLRWAQQAFQNFQLVPPGTGICHQVNLEFLSKVVQTRGEAGERVAFPDTVVGMDSHTTMVNGLGVLGWGAGGVEAEAVMLGQPIYLLTPDVVGVRLSGEMPQGATATDFALTLTQLLRKKGVVGKFVEFTGPGVGKLALPDRATLSNMTPEYGATSTLFPVDEETLRYLRGTARSPELIDLVERYTKAQGLFRTDDGPEPYFSDLLELDLGTIEPSLAGPRRPQDRVPLGRTRQSLQEAYPRQFAAAQPKGSGGVAVEAPTKVTHGSVVIAAITSCTNTSNPSVLIGAGLLAKKAVERGLSVSPHVKTSLAPGSRAVTGYLKEAGLMPYLEALHFHLAGYGCTTCIGNSGPLPEEVTRQVKEEELVVAAVLSGNRNFEGRIHPLVRASYLASPPLVVAFALAGRVDIDLNSEPIGEDPNGQPVYLREIWPSQEEIQQVVGRALKPELFAETYAHVFEGDEHWTSLPVPPGELYAWDPSSTYVQEPPFFQQFGLEPTEPGDIVGARTLAVLGDSVTTDHISPAGSIPADGPAGSFLIDHGVTPREFNSFGARRGNHLVMMRGTFGNIRLKNQLVPGREGPWTVHLPDGETMTIFDASERYRAEGTPLVVFAGKEYGSGSSRDWAAKGPMLLGVRAVLAESYERIHRSNLVGMGIMPLQFRPGDTMASLGLTGRESYDVIGIAGGVRPRQEVTVRVHREDGSQFSFQAIARIDGPIDVEYYRNGGILQTVLRQLLKQ